MADLAEMCIDAGFSNVRTYIASGNVVFQSKLSASRARAALEQRLMSYSGKPIGVVIRTAGELAAVLEANPFKNAHPSKAVAIFLDSPPAADALTRAAGRNREEMRLGEREIYVHYADGIGRSKLTIPAAREGTMRNMNTIAKLVAIAAQTRA
jgi:uncharacterized protein (DUF1697 family)